eukprot:scaffold5125_cov156-Amphora_coffeaeformis.AAC.8
MMISTFLAVLGITSIASASAVALQCGPTLESGVAGTYDTKPLLITSQEGDTVSFTVVNTISDDVLCALMVDYLSTTGTGTRACASNDNVAPGQYFEYTAKCEDDGYATIDIYAYDPVFGPVDSVPTIADTCPTKSAESTYKYSYKVPCNQECTPSAKPTCDSFPTTFDFESRVGDWLFASAPSGYLVLDDSTLATTMAFDIPSTAENVIYEFELTEVSTFANDQKVYVRAGEYYLDVSSALDLSSASTTFNEMDLSMTKTGDVFKFSVKIPSSVYPDGRLVLGVRSFGSSVTAKAGVDNVSVSAPCSQKIGGGGGDPHFQRWGREHTSFHGECDLVMVQSNSFHQGAGLDLHVRTTIEDYFSYIETAVLRVGNDVVEFHKKNMYINNVEIIPSELPVTFGGAFKYTISNGEVETVMNPKFYQYYKVDLNEDSTMLFKFYKQYLTISISGHPADFGDSVGLLGEYHTGRMISRSGVVMDNYKDYGFEWQVNPEDAKLFREDRSPQLPYEVCRLPTAPRPARRLRSATVRLLHDNAHKACSHVPSSSDFDLCIEDVMATGDVGLASLW